MAARRNFELHYLSQSFYAKYNEIDYPEIEHKERRPYIVLLIRLHDNTFALPFRTNIRHNNCYKFRNSSRPTDAVTGIDFSKAVVVNDPSYIGEHADIDNKEYIELSERSSFIISRFNTYLNGYYSYVSGRTHAQQARQYRYTSLQYFHKELGIE